MYASSVLRHLSFTFVLLDKKVECVFGSHSETNAFEHDVKLGNLKLFSAFIMFRSFLEYSMKEKGLLCFLCCGCLCNISDA